MDKISFLVIAVIPGLVLKFLFLKFKNKIEAKQQEAIDAQIIGDKKPTKPSSELQFVASEDLTTELAACSKWFLRTQDRRRLVNVRYLDIEKLDFSLDSLSVLDAWLEGIWKAKSQLVGGLLEDSMLWAGAYVGEVIRIHSENKFMWIGYAEFMSTHENSLRNMLPFSFEYQFILLGPQDISAFPFSKVSKFMDNGPEESLHYFAKSYCG